MGMYVGRCTHEGQVVVGKVMGNDLWYPFGCKEHNVSDWTRYEILTIFDHDRVVWRKNDNPKKYPRGAVPLGQHQSGAPMYVGRMQHGGQLVVGKVLKDDFWYSYGGEEIHIKGGHQNYTVLCIDN